VIGVARKRLPVAAEVPPAPKLDSDHVQTNHGKVQVKAPGQPESIDSTPYSYQTLTDFKNYFTGIAYYCIGNLQ